MPASLARKVLASAGRLVPGALRRRLARAALLALTETEKLELGIPSVEGLLLRARDNGFAPKTIVDVGAYAGDWTRMAAAVFPGSRCILVDAEPAREAILAAVARDLGERASVRIALLGARRADREAFHRMEGGGSSALKELTTFPRDTIEVAMHTLDEVACPGDCARPFLLKLDVQGYELEVLRGGPATLSSAEMVILEASLLPYNEGAPLLADVVRFMADAGFLVFDVCGKHHRESDGALFQMDVAFVWKDSPLRSPRKFFSREP